MCLYVLAINCCIKFQHKLVRFSKHLDYKVCMQSYVHKPCKSLLSVEFYVHYVSRFLSQLSFIATHYLLLCVPLWCLKNEFRLFTTTRVRAWITSSYLRNGLHWNHIFYDLDWELSFEYATCFKNTRCVGWTFCAKWSYRQTLL